MQQISWLEQIVFPVELELRRLCHLLDRRSTQITVQSLNLSATQERALVELMIENQMLVLFVERAGKGAQRILQASESFQKRYIAAHYSMQKHKEEFSRVLEKLNNDHVSFTVLKAMPHLAASRETLHKEVCDIDILISVSEFYKTTQTLRSLGYGKVIDHHATPQAGKAVFGQYYVPQQEEIFYKNPFTVEIHTSIVNTTGINSRFFQSTSAQELTEELTRGSKKIYFLGQSIRVPNSTRLFMSLFIHTFYHHHFQSVVQFYEAAYVLRTARTTFDWEYCFDLCRRYRLTNQFYWYLSFLDWLFPRVLPQRIRLSVSAYRHSFSLVQKGVYLLLKYRIFYPKSQAPSSIFIKITRRIMEGVFVSSLSN